MSNAVGIEFPKKDVSELWRQIERAQKELGKDIGQAVRFGAWSVARSLGVVTNVSKKYRPYKAVKQSRGKSNYKGVKKFTVTSWKKGNKNKFTVYAPKVSELKKMPQVRIGKAGLAKSSWMRGIRQIGGGQNISMAGTTKTAKDQGKRVIDVEKNLKSNNPFVKITNKLNYITDAMKGKEGAVTSAMGKASRAMAKIIDEKIKKRMLK
jgi:hypothetical protein